jgi:hypothetical protein
MSRPILIAAVVFLSFLVAAPPGEAAWTWPVRGEVITPYRNGDDPYAGGQHRGVDIAGDVGAPVVAATPGEVRFAGVAGVSGLTVSLRTADGRYDTSYLHLSAISVNKGDPVAAGDRLGAVGTTGTRSAVAPHLHFGVRDAGSSAAYHDPLGFLPPLATTGAPQPAAPAPAPEAVPSAPSPNPVPQPAPTARRAPSPERAPRLTPRAVPNRLPNPAAGRARRAPGRVSHPAAGRVRQGAPGRVAHPEAGRGPHGAPGRVAHPEAGRVRHGALGRVLHPEAGTVRHAAPIRVSPTNGHRVRDGALKRVPDRTPADVHRSRLADGPASATLADVDRRASRAPSPEGRSSSPRASAPPEHAHSEATRPAAPDAPGSGRVSGPDAGWALACLGLLLAAALVGTSGGGRDFVKRRGAAVGKAVRPLLGRG